MYIQRKKENVFSDKVKAEMNKSAKHIQIKNVVNNTSDSYKELTEELQNSLKKNRKFVSTVFF